MTAPRRIQRRRTAGWRMPEGAIYVGRPSRWGNWYVIGKANDNAPARWGLTDALVVRSVNKWGHHTGAHWAGFADISEARAFAVDLYRRSLEATYVGPDGALNREFYLDGLAGHDLACWCPLDQPCHADVLLELANEGRRL